MATKETLASRREKLEEDLKQTQRHIYDGEEAYIAETSHYGNVVKGWDTYLATTDIKAPHSSRKPKVNDKDRVFTLSSPSYVTEDDGLDDDDDLGGGGNVGGSHHHGYLDSSSATDKHRKKTTGGGGGSGAAGAGNAGRRYRDDDLYD